MEEIFPDVLYISQSGNGEDVYLSASKTEQEAIAATDESDRALVAEYRLVKKRQRKIVTSVEDDDA
jgi:hypothetical protein